MSEKFRQWDYGSAVRVTVKDEDSAVVDISSADLTLSLRAPDGTLVERAMTVTDGAAGRATYTLADGDLSQKGVWSLQVVCTWADAERYTKRVSFVVGPVHRRA